MVELIAAILLLIPEHTKKGAFLTAGTMGGAPVSHALFLGFAELAGQLAGMTVVALICAAILIWKLPKNPGSRFL